MSKHNHLKDNPNINAKIISAPRNSHKKVLNKYIYFYTSLTFYNKTEYQYIFISLISSFSQSNVDACNVINLARFASTVMKKCMSCQAWKLPFEHERPFETLTASTTCHGVSQAK